MRVGVLLNGCGHRDGTEIREAIYAMTALDEQGWEVQCIGIDADQAVVINHLRGEPTQEKRNMLLEAARIARGEIVALSSVKPADIDALVIPGGFGSAMNLCDFASKGHEMTVRDDVASLIRGMHEAKKPIAAICIAPVVVSKVLGNHHIKVTIGDDKEVADSIERMGAVHVTCAKGGCVVDDDHKIITTPAYMYGDSKMKEVFAGIRQMAIAMKNWLD